jgi:hypothetical protein
MLSPSEGKSTFDLLFKFGAIKVKEEMDSTTVQGAVLSDMRAIKTFSFLYMFIYFFK